MYKRQLTKCVVTALNQQNNYTLFIATKHLELHRIFHLTCIHFYVQVPLFFHIHLKKSLALPGDCWFVHEPIETSLSVSMFFSAIKFFRIPIIVILNTVVLAHLMVYLVFRILYLWYQLWKPRYYGIPLPLSTSGTEAWIIALFQLAEICCQVIFSFC